VGLDMGDQLVGHIKGLIAHDWIVTRARFLTVN